MESTNSTRALVVMNARRCVKDPEERENHELSFRKLHNWLGNPRSDQCRIGAEQGEKWTQLVFTVSALGSHRNILDCHIRAGSQRPDLAAG